MIPEIREKYNAQFTQEKYQDFLAYANSAFQHTVGFRMAETPVFIPKDLKNKIMEACAEITDYLCSPQFKIDTKNAVPKNVQVPNEDAHTLFIAIDFGICTDENGNLVPKLIELQGFPTLYCWEHFLTEAFEKKMWVPEGFSSYLNGFESEKYLEILKHSLLGKHNPENVILLEVEPEKQGTNIDFYVTEAFTGIKPVCITTVIREGRNLFYMNNGVKTPIYRIYNRVIFDEFLKRTDLHCQFNMIDDVDVEWAGHPNWFFKISKYTIPFLKKSQYVPETQFLDKFTEIPKDLENYVLKPLFSFSGDGIIFNVTPEDIAKIENRENYQLQRKVTYAQALKSPDGGVKCEIRILFLWPDGQERPISIINLTRLSKGDLIGVKFNKNKTWVGGTISYFEND